MLRRSTLMASDMLRLWKNYWRSEKKKINGDVRNPKNPAKPFP